MKRFFAVLILLATMCNFTACNNAGDNSSKEDISDSHSMENVSIELQQSEASNSSIDTSIDENQSEIDVFLPTDDSKNPEVELPNDIIINEVMTSNSEYAPSNGEYYDVVEIYNNADHTVNLSEYTFSDKRSQLNRYQFPNTQLDSGDYYIIYCSGDTSLGKNHASFKIDSAGETIFLSKNDTIIDSVEIPSDVWKNESYGRTAEGFAYFPSPTIGKKNGVGYESSLSTPQSNYSSGVYEEKISVTLQGTGTIYYTLDGSRPTTESQIFKEPIPISDVTTIRTFCQEDGRNSGITSYTYIIDKSHQLPIVTLSIPQECLTGEEGVLNNILKNYEYESVVTLIENGEEKFSVPCGFRLHGNGSRKGAKQNFQLRFRSEYGLGKLHYPLFESRDIEEYDSLLLKGGSEDWIRAVLRDEFSSAIVDGKTNLYTQAIKPVVLYLSGEYWGIYYFRERFNDEYVAEHMNVSPESVDILESTKAKAECGSDVSFHQLREYVEEHDMSKVENFNYLAERIDITSLLDWYICRSYIGDKDLANIRRFRSTEADGKWRWMWYDNDWAFYSVSSNPFSSIVNDKNGEPLLMRAILKSEQGKEALLTRYAELLNTILNHEYFESVLDGIVNTIESEIPRDRERWGYSVKSWKNAVQQVRDYTKNNARTKLVLSDLKSYFNLSDEDMVHYFGEMYQQ